MSNLTSNAQDQVKNLNNLLSQTTRLANGGNISKFTIIGDGKEDLKTITDINIALGRTLKIEQELKENGKIKTVDSTNYDKIYNARLKDAQLRVKHLKQEQIDRENALQDHIKLMRKEAEQKLKYYTNSKTMQAKEFDLNNAEYLRGVKLREKLDEQQQKTRQKNINESVKQMQAEQKEREKNQKKYIDLLRQEKEQKLSSYINSQKIKSKDFDAENAEYLRGIKLREQAERNAFEERKKRIQQEVKLLQAEQKEREKSQQNSIRLLRLQTEERVKAHLNSVRLQNKELDLQRQLEQFKKQAEINVQGANRKYAGLVNTNELNKYLSDSQALVINPNVKHEMKELTTRLNAITESAKNSASAMNTSSKSAMTFGQALKTAFEKFPIWIIASTAVMDVIHKIQEAFAYM